MDVSVLVPLYNEAESLPSLHEWIVRVMKEHHFTYEIVFVNDGSTDSTESIIKEYKDSRIHYFKNKNQGIGKTRNFGISKATGKYIMFIDSDDFIHKDFYKELMNLIEKNAIVYSAR